MEKPHVFHTLDALRGVAAIAVMEFHTFRFFGGQIFPRGYLAVDFFFMLSGFVLTFAYQQKLDSGWSAKEFLKTRFIRLYPLYLLGLLAGLAFSVLQSRYGKVHLTSSEYLVLVVLGALLLPAPSMYAAGGPATFPLNVPAWSLFYEAFANILHATFLRRRGSKLLASATVLSGVAFIGFSIHLGTMNFGVYRNETLYGISRVMFSYLMGMVLLRVWRAGRFRVSVPAEAIVVVFFGALMIPEQLRHAIALNLFFVMCLFPLLLLAGASARLPSWLERPGTLLGAASYALYVLHIPIAESFEQVWIRVRGHRIEGDAPWPGIVFLLLTLLIALAVDRIYDIPVRGILRRKLSGGARPSKKSIEILHS